MDRLTDTVKGKR